MTNYRAEQIINISGWECGTEIELRQVVMFSVLPGSMGTDVSTSDPTSVEIESIRYFEDATSEVKIASFDDVFAKSESFKAWLLEDTFEQRAMAANDTADAKSEIRQVLGIDGSKT